MTAIFVYALCEPDTCEIRYVGASKDPKLRLWQHLKPTELSKNHPKSRWLKTLKDKGTKPIIFILEEATETSWVEAEMGWIAYCREHGANLTNISPGGHAVAAETTLKMIATQKVLRPFKRFGGLTSESAKRLFGVSENGNGNGRKIRRRKGIIPSPETRAKLSASAHKRWRENSSERQKNSEFMKERWADPVLRAKMIAGYHKGRFQKAEGTQQ